MTQQDTTDWYPPHINPVRMGYYQRNYGDPGVLNKVPDYWNGQRWIICDQNGEARRRPDGTLQPSDNPLPWRGLRRPKE